MPDFNKNDFSGNPVRLDTSRSKFRLPFKHKTTFNAGLVVPIFSYGDVLPGDTFDLSLSSLVRMSTPVFPTMDDAYMDVYFFFTPHKLTLSREMMSPSVADSTRSWKAFIGAQDSLLNVPTPSEILLPMMYIPKTDASGAEIGSLADYLGLPISGGDQVISCLEPLAYYAIWNSYFRDENTMQPVTYSIGSVVTSTNPDINGRSYAILSGFDSRFSGHGQSIGYASNILPACRPHGYFGSALPWPQRNLNMVNISLGSLAPVVTGSSELHSVGEYAVRMSYSTDGGIGGGMYLDPDTSRIGTHSGISVESGTFNSILATNLYADLNAAGGISVNNLRLLVQTQRWYEALARGGNRIGELTSSMFGVTPADYAQDRPEYLGGKRIRIQMDQVANSSADVGALGAFSNTGDFSHFFTKSFDTWGTITGIVVVRTNESFTQGINRRFSRKSRFDFYWPQFANLGEQPIKNKEIYVGSSYSGTDNDVFGYQEAWAEYRFLPDIVSGLLRPTESLGAYTYANNFSTLPTLDGYIDATGVKSNIDRTLKVKSTASGFQFIGDFAFDIVATRPMPRYSIPGLVDHH